MKVLFVNNRLGVKQYHLACALTDQYDAECFFAQSSSPRLPFKKRVKKMIKTQILNREVDRRIFIQKNDPIHPFKKITVLKNGVCESIDPDIVYLSSYAEKYPEELGNNIPVFYDIEDYRGLHRDIISAEILNSAIEMNSEIIQRNNVIGVSSGSANEVREVAQLSDKPTILLYPFVAKRTLPKTTRSKYQEFSVVFAGGVAFTGYRDLLPFWEIAQTNIIMGIFLNNSDRYWYWKHFRKLEKKYSNVVLYRRKGFHEIKKLISKFHVGLTFNRVGFLKTEATFGMKPLEYAYANVQPCAIGSPLKNLSNHKEFGYCAEPSTIQTNYCDNLKNFDWNYHLMDHRIDSFYTLLEQYT